MPTAAVLPIKRFALAKQRLGVTLGAADRRTLAAAMVGDVLDALRRVDALDLGTVVVTAEPAAAEAARAAGAAVVHDEREAGQSAAALQGIDAAIRRGAERVLLVPGDCPALDPAELAALLAEDAGRHGARAVVVPDRHGTGTNALLLAPPTCLEPAFGPGSFARHTAPGGPAICVAELPSLALDVDTADDLAALRAALAARPGGASRTRAVLDGALAAA